MNKSLHAELWEDSLPSGDITDIDNIRDSALLLAMITATNQRLPRFCKPATIARMGSVSVALEELEIVAASDALHPASGLPERFFFGMGREDELYVSGTIEGPQVYGVPFVGYIETCDDLRRKGYASRILPILHSVSQHLYDCPLSSGPSYYLSNDGQALQASQARVHGLRQNHLGFIVGK